ncbi:hypothetical protein C8Q80DRAFT_1275017 [Daedaleopsis nitida]|nr:hypothetical protein C8Q80DRAFT_1275017 [Daedaleopsis nitida]
MRAPPSCFFLPSPSSKSRSSGKGCRPLIGPTPLCLFEPVFASYEKRMVFLVALLTCAMLASFRTAYYLLMTRRVAVQVLVCIVRIFTPRKVDVDASCVLAASAHIVRPEPRPKSS